MYRSRGDWARFFFKNKKNPMQDRLNKIRNPDAGQNLGRIFLSLFFNLQRLLYVSLNSAFEVGYTTGLLRTVTSCCRSPDETIRRRPCKRILGGQDSYSLKQSFSPILGTRIPRYYRYPTRGRQANTHLSNPFIISCRTTAIAEHVDG